MRIFTDLSDLPSFHAPSGLTIGTFDGVHLGHQALLKALRAKITPQGTLTVLTFSNHPADLFAHRAPSPLLATIDHKLKLLEEAGVDICILIPFTPAFAEQSFTAFLTKLKQRLSLSHLLLGEDASFGKDREGDELHVRALAQTLHFSVNYLPKVFIDNQPVSSGRVRTHLIKGEFQAVEALLGRSYSIYAPLFQENTHYQLKVPGLCLPPDGIYPVQMLLSGSPHLGRAHVDQKRALVRIDLPHWEEISFNHLKPLVELTFLIN